MAESALLSVPSIRYAFPLSGSELGLAVDGTDTGGTDDGPQINNLLSGTNTGVVALPLGTMRINTSIVIPDNVRLIGPPGSQLVGGTELSAAGANIVKMTGNNSHLGGLHVKWGQVHGGTGTRYGVEVSGNDCLVVSCRMEGPGDAAGTSTAPFIATGLRPLVLDCEVFNSTNTYGVAMQGCTGGVFRNVTAHHNYFDGFKTTATTNRMLILDSCVSHTNGTVNPSNGNGYDINDDIDGLTMKGCEAYDNDGAGIQIKTTAPSNPAASNISVSACRSYNNIGHGIGGVGDSGTTTSIPNTVSISNCHMWGNTESGIHLNNCWAWTISNCQIWKNLRSGMHLGSDTTGGHHTVSNCIVAANGDNLSNAYQMILRGVGTRVSNVKLMRVWPGDYVDEAAMIIGDDALGSFWRNLFVDNIGSGTDDILLTNCDLYREGLSGGASTAPTESLTLPTSGKIVTRYYGT